MKLTGPGGDSFELRISGYQFPENADDFYDANWLFIEADAAIAGRSWTTRDPALCTFEIKELYEWLRELADGSTNRDTFEATEPNYRFIALGRASNSKHSIRVVLELEVRPPWAVQKTAYHDDCWIDLECSIDQLLLWADDLEKQLSSFPMRGEALNAPKRWDAKPEKKSRWERLKSVFARPN